MSPQLEPETNSHCPTHRQPYDECDLWREVAGDGKPCRNQPGMTWCASCMDWFAAQRAHKPNFTKQGHIQRCPCSCHKDDAPTPVLKENAP